MIQRRRFRPLLQLLVLATALLIVVPVACSSREYGLVDPEGEIDWNRYYTSAETNQILRELQALYPDFVEVYSIGESYRGAELLVIEITNERTGPSSEKPGFYVDGNIHSGELTGSAVALYLAGYLLDRHGSDPEVTELLDKGVFYIRPKFNPDGADLALLSDQWLRSTTRPWDEDEDGEADEDPPEDLNGDGWITMMRIPDPEGPAAADPADSRIMIQPPRGGEQAAPLPAGAQRYRLLREGTDNDGDGEINEDGYGGIDMNRNFPRNWERVHLQSGAGPFPLSEPETYATLEFIMAHPNITGIVHGHTSGGFVFRLPSASDPSLFPSDDLALIEHLGAFYTESTGRPVRPSSTHPTQHRYGTLLTFAYWDQGIVGWVPEYSPGPDAWVTDYDGNGEIDESEELRFDEEELGGQYFSPWTPYDHPQLGPVEIGGWRTKFWGQNPPQEFLEAECQAQVPWILYLARQHPILTLSEPVVTPLGDNRFQVEVEVSNTGFLPTSLTDRGAVGRSLPDGTVRDLVVAPPHVVLSHRGLEIEEGVTRVNVGHLAGSNPFLKAATQRSRTLRWVVRRTGDESSVMITARSDKAGTVRSDWVVVQ